MTTAAEPWEGLRSFGQVMEQALYDPEHGFYSSGGSAGRRGDFLTSPEVGPLFGAVVARALDQWWREAGEPSPFTVIEGGAGPGTLARSVLAAAPACAPALRYVLVERSAAQRERHAPLLQRDDTRGASRVDLPPAGDPTSTVVLANELLDNLPFDLLERTADGWAEVRVDGTSEPLTEVLVPVDDAGWCDELAPGAVTGARVPVQRAAADWVSAARLLADRVVVFDFAATTREMAARPQTDWVRTYRRHQRGGRPLADLGQQDITVEVAIDQLPRPTGSWSQAAWLRAHGIEHLVAEGRQEWADRGHIGDLAAVRGRSRVTEAEALLDPGGLGGFRVLEWVVPETH